MSLDLISLSKAYEDETSNMSLPVLDNAHFRVGESEFVSLVGLSGCGKTTLLRVIAGLDRNWTGQVLLDGRDISYETDRVGLVFQGYALFPWRTTLQNIQFGLEIMGVEKLQKLSLVMKYVESFGLRGFENSYPKELSGGMQQRVAIARTVITSPRVILMDEAVFLSDRILVLSKRPARVIKDFEVTCKRPRDRTSTECNKIGRDVLDILKKLIRKGVLKR